MTRKATVGLIVAASVLVLALGLVVALRALDAKDEPAGQSTLRGRVDLIERDPLVLAVLAVPHSTQSTQESLRCQPAGSTAHWNVREVAFGGLDVARVRALLADPGAFGWQSTGPASFRKSIEPGVMADLSAGFAPERVELTVNASDGLACQPG